MYLPILIMNVFDFSLIFLLFLKNSSKIEIHVFDQNYVQKYV